MTSSLILFHDFIKKEGDFYNILGISRKLVGVRQVEDLAMCEKCD